MGSSSKKVTVGYKYYIGMHMVLCHGPVDSLLEIEVDGRVAWRGRRQSGPLNIDQPSLFGGESREGGISGTVDVLSGAPGQGINDYLQSKIGGLVPAFRGVFSLVLRQVYVGLNPYLKKWAFRVKRIHTRQNGIKQWYDVKAEIGGDTVTADPSKYANIYDGATLRTIDFNGLVWLTAGDRSSLRRAPTNGEFWQPIEPGFGESIRAIAGNASGVFITTGGGFSALLRSADNGSNFSLVAIPSISPGQVRPTCICWAGSNTVMVGCNYAGFGEVSISQDGGQTWTQVPNPGGYSLGSVPTSIVWAGGGTFLASTVSGDVYKSTNTGRTWTLTDKKFVERLFKTPFNILAINEGRSISRSSDIGATWQDSEPLDFVPRAISHFNDLLVCVGDGGKIALSFDYGATWETLAQTLAGGAHLLDIKSNGVDLAYAVGTGGVAARIEIIHSRKGDMNPAHIIRECLTDPDWGMGYSDAEVDDQSFMAAADQLYNEQMGISILWDRQTPIEDFIGEILRHIDAVLYVDRKTGLFTLKLIRGGYNKDNLIHLNEDNIEKIENFTRPAFGELTNAVTVNYWDTNTGRDASVSAQDIALQQMQGVTIGTTIQYPGFTDPALASRVAQRDLKSLSSQRASCTIYADRTAKDLTIGDVFKLSWADYGLNEVVMRVTGIAYGDGKTNRVRINATQDVFDLPDSAIIEPQPPEWEDPVQEPQPVTKQIAFEVPYRELVQLFGQASIDSLLASGPEIGFVGVAAARPEGTAINARVYVDAGSGYEDIAGVEFCPTAELASGVDRFATVFPLTNWVDYSLIEPSTLAQIGEELVFVTSIDATSVTVKRGVLDTIPLDHPAGTSIYFWDAFAAVDQTEYLSGESVNIRITPVSGGGQVDLADATTMELLFRGRANRPYRPGNLKGNGEYQPGAFTGEVTWPLVLTWAHRNRLQDTAAEPVGYYEGTVTPEPSVTYSVRVVELDATGAEGAILYTETGITAETASIPFSAVELSEAPAFLVGVKAVRDGVESFTEARLLIPWALQAPTGLTATPEEY